MTSPMRQATLLALVLFVVAVSTFAQTPTLNVYENFEGGANGQTLTTSILNAGLVCNNAAGVWTLTGNAATQMQVATAAEAPLPTPITACGQVFSPPDGTRGVTYNLNTSSVGYAQFTWTATSNNASLGAWFKTDLPTSDTNYHSMLAISDGTGDFAGLMIHNGFFYLEAGVNPNGNPNVGSFFPYTANKWYWVSEQFQAYVSSSSMHSLAIFDCGTPQTPVLPCTQLSLQKKFTATFGTVKPNFFVVGKDGDTGTPSNFVYYDNLLGDTTGQTFPILPNSGPLIAGLSQTVGAIGTSITITGANFGTPQGTSSVTFNGTTAAPSSWSPTSIVVPVPPGATTGNVVVTVNALPSNGVNFTVTSLPTITALTPASGPVGTLVTISGANFGSSQPSSTVTFNNTPATPTSWSDTGISVPVPGGSTSGSVLVNVAGVVSNGMNFAVTSGAPIALVQHTNLDAGTTTKASLAFKSNNTAGNWIAVAVRAGSSSSQVFTITDSNGNTYRSAFQLGIASSTYAFALFYAENIKSGANTITVSDTVSGPLRFAISEYSGVAKSNSLDGTPATATATNALANSGNLTTTASGDLLLAAIVTHNSATFVAGSGYTIEDSVPAEPNTKLITEDEIQLSAGAVSATAALGASDTWGAGLAAFKPAASGGVAGTPASISATAGTPQSATINTSFTIQLQATVKDSSNNPVSGVIVTFNAPSSGASGSFAGGVSTAITNASGVAVSAVFMANTTAGAYTVTASVPGVASSANFSLINLAGQAASIVATAGTPQSATVNTAFPVQLQGTVKDSFNNPVSGVVVTFAAPSSGPSGTFALGTSTALTDAQGIATAAIFTANGMIGAYTVSASVSGVSAPANFSLTNLSNPAASIAPTSGTPQSVTVNSAFVAPLQVTVLDAFDNPVSGATVTFTPPNSGPSGIFAGGVNTARTNAQGIATAPTFTANSIAGGPYALTASVSGVPTNAAFSLTNLAGVASNIVLVQHTSKDAGTATTTSLAFGKPNVAGNWIAVVIRAGNSSSQVFKVTDSNGNTYRQAIQFGQTTAKDTLGIFYSESIKGGANTVTVSDNVSGILRVVILEYSGVAPANSIDGTAAAQGSNASPNSGPLTTTAGGDLLLGAVITFNSGTFIAGAGYTIEDLVPAEPNTKLIDEDQVQKAAATVSAGASLTASDNWAAGLVGFKAATGVGGASPTIAGLAPSAGAVGTSVTITGLNFGTPQGTSTLSFNGTPATPSSWTSTRIVVPVPGGATSGNVVVTVGGVASNA
ncbi:MAG TPA: IPT/TIG domain-containing protein, partial [Candidatus Bathyarchaeia archaeon]|nr:IPT/TIG domain-containing protein [Candidatus Bathyarchaeia archaeon]